MTKSFVIGFEGSWPADSPVAWAAAAILTNGVLLNSVSGATSSAIDVSTYRADGLITIMPRTFELFDPLTQPDTRHLWVVATRGLPDIDTDADGYEESFVAWQRVGDECYYLFRSELGRGGALDSVRRLIQVAWMKDLQRVARALTILRARPDEDILALRRAVQDAAEALGVE